MDPLIGRVLMNRYEVLQRIGAGGMGAVYTAAQKAVNRKIALKVLRSDLMSNEHVRQRFKREAEIIGKLSHPNTIQLIDYNETEDGMAIMVMELLNGQSLSERLKSDGPLALMDSIRLGEEVSGSLAEAHLLGLVHRDLKPANIFLNEVGNRKHAKVLDFGIARLMDEEATRLTSTGQVFGTPRYMSPEQAMSTASVDARSDLYSLGLILFECVVGQPPFVAQTSIQYLSAHSTQEPPKLREHYHQAPIALEELIDACLEKDPDARPQSAEEVGDTLSAIRRSLESGGATAPIQVPRGPSYVAPGTAGTTTALTEPDGRTPAQIPPKDPHHPGRSLIGDPPQPTPGKSPLLFIGVGLASIAAVIVLAVVFWPPDEQVAPLADTGTAGLARLVEKDAGVVAETAKPDAGEVAAPVDLGTPEAVEEDAGASAVVAATKPDAGKKRIRRPKNWKRRPPPPPPPPPTGNNGIVTGPRAFTIEGLEDEDDSPTAIAKTCKQSSLSGLSKVTTSKCPAGCAIIVDSVCAGRTPATDRALPPGRKKVVVVCNGKVKKSRSLRFRADKTTTFKCR